MAILDSMIPKYYEPLALGFEQQDGDVVARYNIAIRSINGNRVADINRGSTLAPEEKAMVVAMYQRDLAQFEVATGLERWVPPPEEPVE